MRKRRQSLKNKEFFESIIFFSSSILSIFGLIMYLWIYTESDQNMLAIGIQKKVKNELENNLNELKMEISQLSRGDRISKYAIDELGMIPAIPETLIIEINSYN